MSTATGSRLPKVLGVVLFGYLFFLSIDLLGTGMKESFKEPIKHFLETNADQFTELVSFVIGILGTALIQSSSSVTSMCVVLAQEGIMPLVIAAGIVHGANLGTSVTSSVVAFASEAKPFRGNPIEYVRSLLFDPRGPGFQRAVGTAVVHDFFNIIMVTSILLLLELPFKFPSPTGGEDAGWVLWSSEWMAAKMESWTTSSAWLLDILDVVSPGTYTGPVADGLIDLGMPGWLEALIGLPLLFVALRGFSGRMRELLMAGVDTSDAEQVGDVLLGKSDYATFLRGMVVTILVQSSSATTSMVVPLAAMGFFSVRKVFPFILGANIGTTTTALLAATGSLGQPGFHEGMTIALCHLSLNTLAVFFAWVIPGLPSSILGSADWLAERAGQRPIYLLGYLFTLVVVTPALVYFLPMQVSALFMGGITLFMLVGPHVYLREKTARGERTTLGS